MIPQEKLDAVQRGLRDTFGTMDFRDLQAMTAGLSADLVFRIVVRDAPYLLRVVTRIDERSDPARHFASAKIAANGRVAPRVLYANPDDGILITDFVEAKPFSQTEALQRMPAVLRRLHALPPFPKSFNYVTAHNGFIWKFRSAGLVDEREVEEVFARYKQVCPIYPWLNDDIVSCHSDLKPENVLFDGERVWLVDWQAGFLNDRYFDLGIVANFTVTDEVGERNYLEAYFERPPDEYECARFYLMRQVLHMFYATVFLMLGCAGQPVKPEDTPPAFADFHRRIWAGEVNLADLRSRVMYGRVHWERLLSNVRQPRFEDALSTVKRRHAGDRELRLLLPAPPADV